MKRPLFVGAAVLALLMGGCISQEQRESAIETGAIKAGYEAYTRTKAEALKRGLSDDVSEGMAVEAKKIAYDAAKKAGQAIPQTGTLGQIFTTILYGLVQFGLPMLAKKGGGA